MKLGDESFKPIKTMLSLIHILVSQIFYAGFSIAEVTCPTKYFDEASSINFSRSVTYGLGCLQVSLMHRLCKWGILKSDLY